MAHGISFLCGLWNKDIPKTEYRTPVIRVKSSKISNLSESDRKRKQWFC